MSRMLSSLIRFRCTVGFAQMRENAGGILLAIALVIGIGASKVLAQCTAPDYCLESAVLSPAEATNYYQFGFDVAVSGDVLIASNIPQSCSQSPQPCAAAYIYRWNGSAWQEEAKLIDPEGRDGDAFGYSVDIDGDVAIVAAPGAGPTHQEGAALIFRYDGSSWAQEARLTGRDHFGQKVKIQNDMALVSDESSTTAGTSTGAVHVYRKTGSTWTIQDTLEPSVAGNYGSYGTAMDLDNGVLVVGAHYTPWPTWYGAVYIYELVGQQWVERQVIQGAYYRNGLGAALSISGDLLFVGGIQETNPDVAIGYIYRRNGQLWILEDSVIPSDAAAFDGFEVAIEGDLALVGARDQHWSSTYQYGAAYLFHNSGGNWTQVAKFGSAMVVNGHFGQAVALDGQRGFVGALGDPYPPGASTQPGVIYTYSFSISGPDCDCDGLADSCELFAGENDCNDNLVPDSCDVVDATSNDCNLNGIPDECELDCQQNGVPDECDINSGTSLDCNANGMPDECEVVDCNANQVPDDCDIASGTSQDCDGNGRPDECDFIGHDCNANQIPDSCDIASGFSQDANGDGRPDECGPYPLPALLPEPSGVSKVRFISLINPNDTQGNTALRVWLVSLHHVNPPYTGAPAIPFTAFEGLSVWVGPPHTFVESSASGVTFMSSQTQCTPYYQDWTTVGLLHVRGSAIVPSSVYQLEQVSLSCQGQEASCTTLSPRLEIRTARWGDVESPYSPSPGQPSFADIAAMVNKFRGLPGARTKAQLVIRSYTLFGDIPDSFLSVDFGFTNISDVVDAFRGRAYPAKMGRCSGAGTIACTTAADCSSGGNVGPCNLNCNLVP